MRLANRNCQEPFQKGRAELPKFGMAMDGLRPHLEGKQFSKMRSGTVPSFTTIMVKRPVFACWNMFTVSETTVCLSTPQAHSQIIHKRTVKGNVVLKTFEVNRCKDNDKVSVEMAVLSPDKSFRACNKRFEPRSNEKNCSTAFPRK
jgi:hypothetical protein